jgi:hypothetical protein
MESLLLEEEVLSRQTKITAEKQPQLFIWPLDRGQSFTVVSGARFPWSTNGVPTQWRGGLVAPDRSNSWKGLYILIRPFDRAQSFTVVSESCFPWSTYGIPTCWKEVLLRQNRISAEMGQTFDPTVGSPSKFYISFRNLFSLKYLWNPYTLMRISCRARPE